MFGVILGTILCTIFCIIFIFIVISNSHDLDIFPFIGGAILMLLILISGCLAITEYKTQINKMEVYNASNID